MTQTTMAIRFVEGKQYYGISETGRKEKYIVKKITPKFITIANILCDSLSIRMRYSEADGVETIIDGITPTLRYIIRADKPVDTEFVPVATEKKVPHVQTLEEKSRARTNMLLRKYASETEWILRVYRDAMAFMTDEEYEKQYGYKPSACDKVNEYLYECEGETDAIFDYCRGLNFKPRGCKEFKDMGEGYDYEIVKFLSDVISRIGARLTEKETSTATQPANEPVQPENLCDDGSFSDAPGDNSCPEQDIPEPYISEESPDSVRANQREEKFLQCRSISKVKIEIIAMLNKYAENRALIQVIREGVTNIRKCIKICEKQGLPIGAFEKVIKEAHEKYHEFRREGFKLRLKLLRVMSASEIRRACEAYMARYEKKRRRLNE